MKKYKIFAYVFIIICAIAGISFGTYKIVSSNKDKGEESKIKAQTEIKYLEDRLLKIFNKMNNIDFENYKISINEIDTNSSGMSDKKSETSGENDAQSKESSGTEGGEASSSSQEGSESGSSSGNSDTSTSGGSSSSSSKNSSKTTAYSLQNTGVLTDNQNIDWQVIKSEIENMYTSLPTITLDLYQTDIDNQDILNFNTEFDILTKIIQEEDKIKTLAQLVKVSESVVKFSDRCYEEEQRIISRTKQFIYRAYSKLDEKKWNEISTDIAGATEEFTKLMTRYEYKRSKTI